MENNNLGQVKISNEVIVTIAGLAALEVENVETITTITDKLLKNNGVKIQIDEEQIILDIYVNIEFGESIPDTAFKIQENVKNTVETMTGLEVSIVNVHVQGITFYKEKAEKEEAKAQKKEEAKQLAIEFYGPIFLMYSLYDNKREGDDLAEMLKKHVDRFSKKMDSY